MAFPVEQAEVNEDTNHGDIVRPRIGLNPEYCGWGLREHTGNDSRGEDLCEQDCINLSDKRVPDLEAALVHGHSILEIVRNISEAWLVVDSSGAWARLWGSPTA